MLPHRILPDTLNAISSPASEDGATLSDLQDGPILARVGLSVVHANLSARQAKGAGLLMSGTYGPPLIGSSPNVDQSQSLANKLRARLDSRGSTLFTLTWKERRTPAGQLIYALRASGLRTFAKDCTSVPTPRCVTGGAESTTRKQELGRTESGGGDLQAIAQLASVPTPRSEDSQCAGAHRGKPDTLHSQANLANVATPSQRDWKDSVTGENPDGSERLRLDTLPRQAQLADGGEIVTGGTGKTKSSGQLNPDYSRWLQGFPAAWGNCADTGMRLFPGLRRNSSKQAKRLK